MHDGMHKQVEGGGIGVWATPQSFSRPRPTTIHEAGFNYCMPQEYTSFPAWDSSTMPMSSAHENMPQTYSVPQDLYPVSANGLSLSLYSYSLSITNELPDGWMAKPSCDDGMELVNDTDMTIGQALTTDENVPILDLRFSGSGVD